MVFLLVAIASTGDHQFSSGVIVDFINAFN
jgi:hypothetical protein